MEIKVETKGDATRSGARYHNGRIIAHSKNEADKMHAHSG